MVLFGLNYGVDLGVKRFFICPEIRTLSMRKSMHVIQDYDTPVSNYVRMWLKKISHRKFAKRTHTTMGMVQALYIVT